MNISRSILILSVTTNLLLAAGMLNAHWPDQAGQQVREHEQLAFLALAHRHVFAQPAEVGCCYDADQADDAKPCCIYTDANRKFLRWSCN